MYRSFLKKDFDAWAYSINWPRNCCSSPLFGVVDLTVEDIKFAYNAWCLLRLAMFFGVQYPKILSNLTDTTPSMNIQYGGNRLFFMHSRTGANLSTSKVKIALTPNNSRAFPLQMFNWRDHCVDYCKSADGVELVLGMENGLTDNTIDLCDHCMYIPQYGSIGSLSMLSALAIATHTVASEYNRFLSDTSGSKNASLASRSRGHMPLSNSSSSEKTTLPHEADLLNYSNKDIIAILQHRRMQFKLQISVIMHNELGDRNIGAVMRNANVFNCENFIILNRRRFSRRGAVGTQKTLAVHFFDSVSDRQCQQLLENQEIWLLYSYYPYLHIYGDSEQHRAQRMRSFVRADDPLLLEWRSTGHILSLEHPLIVQHSHLYGTEVFLDDEKSLFIAVQNTLERGYKGIVLAVPEEGTSVHPDLAKRCRRVTYVTSPSKVPILIERGLNAALSTAIALERIRYVSDVL